MITDFVEKNMKELTPEHFETLVHSFQKNGFLVLRNAFNPSDLVKFQNEINQSETLKINWRIKYAGGKPSVREISNVYDRTETFKNLLKKSAVLELIEKIFDQKLFLFRDAYIEKMPNQQSFFPLHQDSEFWKISPKSLVSMWIPLQDTNEKNGVLQVVPGSHLTHLNHSVKFGKNFRLPQFINKLLRSSAKNSNTDKKQTLTQKAMLFIINLINGYIIPFLSKYILAFEKFTEFFVVQNDDYYWSKAISADLKLGDIILYHSLTLHGSKGNHLNTIRAAYVPTFMGEKFTSDGVVVSNPQLNYVKVSS